MQLWLILGVGLAIGFAALFVGQHLFRRPREEAAGDVVIDRELFDPFVHGTRDEKRRAGRRRGKYLEIEMSDPDNDHALCQGWVLDRSLGGLRLMGDRDWPPGKILGIRVRDKANCMPWLEIQVRHCKPTTHGWELGCQFVHQPTWNMLLLFG